MSIKNFVIFALLLSFFSAEARIDPEKLKKGNKKGQLEGSRMDCQPSQAQYDLEINNVRARLLTGGDMWWNLQDGRYIVPKPAPGFPEVSAIFAAGIWIGGVDSNGALKLAGVTYRTQNAANNATDYFPGPLDENGQTSAEICNDWDRHFVVKGDNILLHLANYNESVDNNEMYSCESIPDDVKYWPGRGNPFWNEKFDFDLPNQNLADFFDENGNGIYDPCGGDYPILNQRGCEEPQIPDEIVFWIFNDNGGNHVLTGATAIQMEVQAQAFAFAAENELNDMTFYRFKLINKASDDIRDCYFGLWVDPDLGCSEDDYIGCDVSRSMAYVYNEDAVDGNAGSSCGGVPTYEDDVPLLGIDLFRGPRGPKVFCGLDAEGNKVLCDPEPGTGDVDTLVELGMTSFTYQNRGVSNPPTGTLDPDIGFEYYNILKGLWKDGTSMTYGGTGYNPVSTDTTRFAFSSPPSDGQGWSMCTADLPFDDRRTVQATGPLLLLPGAINELIFGVVFVPDVEYPCPNIEKLQFADDLAQALFNNCFEMLEGPDAPDMDGIKLDEQLILILSNDEVFSNNANEEYMAKDLMAPEGVSDPYYKFEGYQIYQLADANVTTQELDDIDKARLLRHVDIKNGVKDIYNWYPVPDPDPSNSEFIWVPENEVFGLDNGIQHSFNITIDLFSNSTNQKLENDKEYHYTVLAYAYNNYQQYDVDEKTGQRKPYLESTKNVRTYTFKPRSLDDIEIPTSYGDEVSVTRIDGIGTSFNALDMADGEVESILDGSFDGQITYKAGNGPINPKVVDPLRIKDGNYRLEIVGEYDDLQGANKFISPGARWDLTNITTGEIIASDKTIDEINEQIIDGQGFSIEVNQVGDPGDEFDENNGALTQVYEYADNGESNWWNAIPAFTGIEVTGNDGSIDYLFPFVDLDVEDDPNNALSMIDNGHFIPIKSARWVNEQIPYLTPGWKTTQGIAIAQNKLRLKELNNVDLVFTADKSKWSKCVVVESAVPDYLASGLLTIGDKKQFELSAGASIDQDGNEIGNGETGMSYFPGYAIDVETGERLNIFFGENSVFNDDNDLLVSQNTGETVNSGGIGNDMIWNPSTKLFTEGLDDFPLAGTYNALVGGQHYIYVTRQEYDECANLKGLLDSGGLLNTSTTVGFVTWTAIPVPAEPLLSLEEGLIPNDLTVKLRVTNPFNKELNSLLSGNTYEAVGGLPLYEFGFENVEVSEMVATEEEPQILDQIRISPNPMYGQSQSNNVVRVDNLQEGSVVSIYTLEGKFIKRFSEELGSTFIKTESGQELEWNLNDSNGAQITGGVYIIHVAVPHLGIQKSFKWIKI